MDGRLAGAVDWSERLREIGSSRRDIGDHARPSMPQHDRHKQVIEVYRTRKENIDLLLSLRPRRIILRKRDSALDTGVVDDDVEAGLFSADIFGQRLTFFGYANIVDESPKARVIVCGTI
jgi:hypothetical protein